MERSIRFMALLLSLLCVSQQFEFTRGEGQRCLSTLGRHKDTPSREPALHECHRFADNACCAPNTTRSLADSSGSHIDTFYWTVCGNVSEQCESYIQAEMCFYYCSPNTYPWAKRILPNTVIHPEDVGETYAKVPICSSWCDSFYAACQDQPICVTNWYTDWNVTYNAARGRNESHCKSDSTCQTFGQRFGSSRGLCNGIFDNSYVYTTGADCLVMTFNSSTGNPNDEVAARLARSNSVAKSWPATWSLFLLSVLAAFLFN